VRAAGTALAPFPGRRDAPLEQAQPGGKEATMNVSKSFGQFVATAAFSAIAAAPLWAQVSKDAPVPPVRREDPKPIDADARGPVSGSDRQTMETMARANMAEVEEGRIAETHAADPAVKKFARQMVQDHGKANRELLEIAARKGVSLPTDLDAADREVLDEVKAKTGPAFDTAYLSEAAVKDHIEAKQLFEDAAKNAEDPELRRYAEKNLPVIERHLEMARQISSSLRKEG
jgi:putative membrane protein